jgi:OmpA-OmpF porin, OOP family
MILTSPTISKLLASLCMMVVLGACASSAIGPMGGAGLSANANGYQAQQEQIKRLNDTGKHSVGSYGLAKAQCWLDASFHEFSRNDRSDFPVLAMAESIKITDYLSAGTTVGAALDPSLQTPLVNNATKLRTDLWDAIGKVKAASGASCAARQTACAQVKLVHAGNEYGQLDWRHAKPYVQMAEDLVSQAQLAAQRCETTAVKLPDPVVTLTTPPAAPVVTAAVPLVSTPKTVALSANVLFGFDKRAIADIRPYTKDQLDAVVRLVVAGGLSIKSLRVIGHADELNSTKDKDYNLKLSRDRMQAVRDYMVAAGVKAETLSTEFKSDSEPVQRCEPSKFRNYLELQECLLPNRRVEVFLEGTKAQ